MAVHISLKCPSHCLLCDRLGCEIIVLINKALSPSEVHHIYLESFGENGLCKNTAGYARLLEEIFDRLSYKKTETFSDKNLSEASCLCSN